MIESVCVFCGSRPGRRAIYAQAAEALGRALARARIRVIYGGGHVGLMGRVADAAMAAGGEVVGMIPERLLEREVGHRTISSLIVTGDMSDRKSRMIEHADAFVVLPGGLGTFDELLEVVTLRQLGYHAKPIILIDLDGFFTLWADLVDKVVEEGFAAPDAPRLFRIVRGVGDALDALAPEHALGGAAAAAGSL